MAVPPPPTEEFEGFSFPPATFAAGTHFCVIELCRALLRSAGVLLQNGTMYFFARTECYSDPFQWRGHE